MTDEELIEFGNKLIAKERTSIEIFNALRHKAENKEQLDRVHKLVVKPEAEKKKRSPEMVRTLLAANKTKLRFEYSIRSLYRLGVGVVILGLLTLYYADEELNGNAPFAWSTLLQGGGLLVLFSIVKNNDAYDFLMIAIVAFAAIFGIELLVFGTPNDLFAALYQGDAYIKGSRVNSGLTLLFGYLFPFLYLSLKVTFGALVFMAFWNHKKYDEQPEDIKTDLKDF
ncbi:MAG: hypothetical protein P8P74_13555 [Crocinitomicaceae bacterium]|nr:hypothetical protein [Crocinitomicaceae bacterium]